MRPAYKPAHPVDQHFTPFPFSLSKPHAPYQVPVAREPDRIDVSDLPPNLPRKELGQYRMIDEGFDLTLVLQLEEPVTKDQVLRVGRGSCGTPVSLKAPAEEPCHLQLGPENEILKESEAAPCLCLQTVSSCPHLHPTRAGQDGL